MMYTKRSIGKLRRMPQTKPRSPACIGKLALRRSTLAVLVEQMRNATGDEIPCNIAGWPNTDDQGDYLTIEISPVFVKSQPNRPTLDQFFGRDEDDIDTA